MSGRPDGSTPDAAGAHAVQWTGVVLAGGQSRRFGGLDKARLRVGGQTLLARAVAALEPLTTAVMVVGARETTTRDAEPDRHPGDGPLGGILTALETTSTTHALVVAVDLPFLTRALLESVRDAGRTADVAHAVHPDGRLALCLSVGREIVPRLRAAWDEGERRVRALMTLGSSVEVAVDPETARRALWNVNDPLTYARALAMAEHDCRAC